MSDVDTTARPVAKCVCVRLPQVEKDLKQLGKKHPSVVKDLVYAERLLTAGITLPQTDAYPGLGNAHTILKTRVLNTDTNKGKSGGYRLIYEAKDNGTRVLLMMLYDKTTYSDENRVKIELSTRLRSPEYLGM